MRNDQKYSVRKAFSDDSGQWYKVTILGTVASLLVDGKVFHWLNDGETLFVVTNGEPPRVSVLAS